jgi:hypothetical protein
VRSAQLPMNPGIAELYSARLTYGRLQVGDPIPEAVYGRLQVGDPIPEAVYGRLQVGDPIPEAVKD